MIPMCLLEKPWPPCFTLTHRTGSDVVIIVKTVALKARIMHDVSNDTTAGKVPYHNKRVTFFCS